MQLKSNHLNFFIDSGGREGQRSVCSEGESRGGDQGEREIGKGKSINKFLRFFVLQICYSKIQKVTVSSKADVISLIC